MSTQQPDHNTPFVVFKFIEIIELCDSFDQLAKLHRLVFHLYPASSPFRDLLVEQINTTKGRLLPSPVIGESEVPND